jgi:hypothetical protein
MKNYTEKAFKDEDEYIRIEAYRALGLTEKCVYTKPTLITNSDIIAREAQKAGTPANRIKLI